MQELPQERLTVGIGALASAEAALQWTLDYTRERKAFGKSVADFQNTRFKLAEMATEIQVGRVFVDRCMEQHLQGKLDVPTAAMCKYWTTDLQCKVLDECVQLHGGYGFMWEYPVARAWADARVQRILRRYQRDHEGDHRAGPVRRAWSPGGADDRIARLSAEPAAAPGPWRLREPGSVAPGGLHRYRRAIPRPASGRRCRDWFPAVPARWRR